MKNEMRGEPRRFQIGEFECRDHGALVFQPPDERTNEIVTLKTASGRACDVAGTSWGFYLGPSLNSRLRGQGFRAAIMVNPKDQIYLVAVEVDQMDRFSRYLQANGSRVLFWLDSCLEPPPPSSE